MGKATEPRCLHCASQKDDALHTFFVCEKWRDERVGLEDDGVRLTPDDIIPHMLAHRETWDNVARCVEKILRHKWADLQ
ncbi:hypothetical protein TSAR_014431 [Trichomalopsis sarcophagae]|uniref:Reverse transcriptase zinc-binding domain-containing protein n=1 Tax=Trichomalopsis sarcophagae TaxID=543379 RepID=A0A232FE83_9HYME|nr:hypothetical protein TSAR_014431 [Trichomalopsis sarcophagae]